MARAAAAAAVSAACHSAPGWIPPTPVSHVTDGTGTLSQAARLELAGTLRRYERRTGHQVVVWISDTLPAGVPLETFAQATFNAWGPGSKRREDGVVLFVLVKDRRARVHVGFGLEHRIPDAEAVRIIRESIAPYTQAGLWDEGITAGVDAILEAIGDPR